jgi:hypothetical protein
MSSVVRIVKRSNREGLNTSRPAEVSLPASDCTSAIVTTVKNWIATTRERRKAEADVALQLIRGLDGGKNSHSQGLSGTSKRTSRVAKNYRTILSTLGLILLLVQTTAHAQGTTPASGESLTLDQAIAIALRNNHGMKIAGLAVERADEDISAAKIFRLPVLRYHQLVSANLAANEIRVPKSA